MEYEGQKLRHELKYYINTVSYEEIRNRLRYVLDFDTGGNSHTVDLNEPNPGYTITSLYFDDMYNSAMDEKINGTRFRKKYRIRIYNHNEDVIKLECKMKYDSYTAKESSNITRNEYNNILEGNYDVLANRTDRVSRELYAYHKLKLLHPVLAVEYLREAYIGKEGNVRITFDKNIAASIGTLDMFSSDFITTDVLPMDLMVLEVKFDDFIPAHLVSMLQSSMTQKCAVSKYIMCRQQNRKVRML